MILGETGLHDYEIKKAITEMSYSKTASDNYDAGFTRTIIFLHLVFAGVFFQSTRKEYQHTTQNPKDDLCNHFRYQNLQKQNQKFQIFLKSNKSKAAK